MMICAGVLLGAVWVWVFIIMIIIIIMGFIGPFICNKICIVGHERIVVPGVARAVVVLFSVADVAFSLVVAAAHRLLCSL